MDRLLGTIQIDCPVVMFAKLSLGMVPRGHLNTIVRHTQHYNDAESVISSSARTRCGVW